MSGINVIKIKMSGAKIGTSHRSFLFLWFPDESEIGFLCRFLYVGEAAVNIFPTVIAAQTSSVRPWARRFWLVFLVSNREMAGAWGHGRQKFLKAREP